LVTVLGISWSLRSRKTLKPIPEISRTQSGPEAVNISRPIFTHRSVPKSFFKAGANSRGEGPSRARIKSHDIDGITNEHEPGEIPAGFGILVVFGRVRPCFLSA